MFHSAEAAIAQLGERQTEDLKVPGSIPGLGMHFFVVLKTQHNTESCRLTKPEAWRSPKSLHMVTLNLAHSPLGLMDKASDL